MIIVLYIIVVLLFFIVFFGGLLFFGLNVDFDRTEDGELLLWYDSYTGSGMEKERKYIILRKKK